MILAGNHVIADFRELWTSKSFRARIFLAVLPTAIGLIVGHYAFDRVPPYTFIESGSFIEPPVGREGDTVTVNWHVDQHRACPGVVERQLIDPRTNVVIALYEPAPAEYNGVYVDSSTLRKQFAIPRNIQRGVIGYKAKLTYKCNWLQAAMPLFAIHYDTPTLLFKVEE